MRTRPCLRYRSYFAVLLLCVLVSGCTKREEPIDQARALIERGRADLAVEVLRSSISDDPDDPALNLVYGAALLAAGQPSLAVWPLANASKNPENSIEAGLLLARAQMAIDSHGDAIDSLEAVLDRDPHNMSALRLQVVSYLESRKPELALEVVETALDLEPDDLGLQMSRMRAMLTLDYSEEAGEALSAIRNQITEIKDISPQQRELLSGRFCAMEAMFTHESGGSDEARGLFAQCLENHPSHPQVISSSVSFLDELGESDEGTQILRDALAQNPTDLMQRVALASRLNALDQPTAAEDLLLEVIDEQPLAWSALVDHYVEVEDQENALLALEHSLTAVGNAAPEDWLLLRADLLIQRGRLEEASEAIGLIRSEVYITTARGRLELARGNPEKALRLLEQGIRLWPDNPMARYLAAQAAEQLGDFERAESEYREAYRSDPAYTDAGLQLAALLASRGLPGDAADLANAYTTANIDDPKGWEAMIGYALAAKRGEKARSTLARYQNIPELRGDAIAFTARYLLRAGRSEDARKAIVTSRTNLAAVENIEALRAWCDVLIAQQKAGIALERLDEMLNRSPDRIEISALRARTLHAAGKSSEARSAYESLLNQHPDNLESLIGLAAIETEQQRSAQAITLLDRAASIDTGDSSLSVAAAMLSASTADKEQRLREALVRNPRDGRAAMELLSILQAGEAGASNEALDLANRARRFAPGKASEDANSEVSRARNTREDDPTDP